MPLISCAGSYAYVSERIWASLRYAVGDTIDDWLGCDSGEDSIEAAEQVMRRDKGT
jgi:hypothetical protein